MQIDVNMKIIRENVLDKEKTEVASGWVEIEQALKFPFKIRKYRDAEQHEKTFISYPQRKKGNGYESVLYPHDKEVREKVEEAIWSKFSNQLYKGKNIKERPEVRVTVLPDNVTGSVTTKALATIKFLGFTINGIAIKEGRDGLFISMPQHKSGEEYYDTVYGTSEGVQTLIRNAVVEEYESLVKESPNKQSEVPLDEVNGVLEIPELEQRRYTGPYEENVYLTKQQAETALELKIPIYAKSRRAEYHGSRKDEYALIPLNSKDDIERKLNWSSGNESMAIIHPGLPMELQQKLLSFCIDASNDKTLENQEVIMHEQFDSMQKEKAAPKVKQDSNKKIVSPKV